MCVCVCVCVPTVVRWLAERRAALGDAQARLAAVVQYIDDTLGVSFNDYVDGTGKRRGEHHAAIFDAAVAACWSRGSCAVAATLCGSAGCESTAVSSNDCPSADTAANVFSFLAANFSSKSAILACRLLYISALGSNSDMFQNTL